jgi:hypothetical protein
MKSKKEEKLLKEKKSSGLDCQIERKEKDVMKP